jgi:hypothetical protein
VRTVEENENCNHAKHEGQHLGVHTPKKSLSANVRNGWKADTNLGAHQ